MLGRRVATLTVNPRRRYASRPPSSTSASSTITARRSGAAQTLTLAQIGGTVRRTASEPTVDPRRPLIRIRGATLTVTMIDPPLAIGARRRSRDRHDHDQHGRCDGLAQVWSSTSVVPPERAALQSASSSFDQRSGWRRDPSRSRVGDGRCGVTGGGVTRDQWRGEAPRRSTWRRGSRNSVDGYRRAQPDAVQGPGGWGYLLLTTSSQPGTAPSRFTRMRRTSTATALLGSKTITCTNATATLPLAHRHARKVGRRIARRL